METRIRSTTVRQVQRRANQYEVIVAYTDGHEQTVKAPTGENQAEAYRNAEKLRAQLIEMGK